MKRSWAGFVLLILLVLLVGTPDAQARNLAYGLTLTPSVSGYLFDGGEELDPGLLGGFALGYNFTRNWGGEISVAYGGASEDIPGGRDVDLFLSRLETLYHFAPEGPLVPFLAGGIGGISVDPDGGGSDYRLLFGYGGGVKFFLDDRWALRCDARHLVTFKDLHFGGPERHNVMLSGALVFQIPENPLETGPNDGDGDGVIDALDHCPDSPPGIVVDGRGCPVDSDKDGVPDYHDICPDTPRGKTVNRVGCPEVRGSDADGDGVADSHDKCPNTPAYIPVNTYGCPSDSDGDMVFDFEDKCSDTPKNTRVGPDGCPLK